LRDVEHRDYQPTVLSFTLYETYDSPPGREQTRPASPIQSAGSSETTSELRTPGLEPGIHFDCAGRSRGRRTRCRFEHPACRPAWCIARWRPLCHPSSGLPLRECLSGRSRVWPSGRHANESVLLRRGDAARYLVAASGVRPGGKFCRRQLAKRRRGFHRGGFGDQADLVVQSMVASTRATSSYRAGTEVAWLSGHTHHVTTSPL